MISIDASSVSSKENYQLLTNSIIPRPIAFVTSLSQEGIVNAAPFSYFNIVASDPPLISISIQRKNGNIQKDTARNIQDHGEFVVHVTDETIIQAVNQTSSNLPPNESEVESTGLNTIASEKVQVPGIQEAPIRMECILEQIITLGGSETSPACDLIIGKVVYYHIAEKAINPVSRLGGNQYSKLGEIFTLDRPQ